jgi:hypothetical protein
MEKNLPDDLGENIKEMLVPSTNQKSTIGEVVDEKVIIRDAI